MLDTNLPETRFALQAVRQAALLVQQIQQESDAETMIKGDRSPVTVADYAAQAAVGHHLGDTFPEDPLVAEEDARALARSEAAPTLDHVTAFMRQALPSATPPRVLAWIGRGGGRPSRRFWTLDPIDGTKGFLRGDQYAVALALIEDGQVQLGVLGCPNLRAGLHPDPGGPGSLIVAARGQGAWVAPLVDAGEFHRLQVSDRKNPAGARLLRSFEAGHTNVGKVDLLAESLGVRAEPVRMDSQAKYAVLAAGGGELLVRLLSPRQPDYREKIWDQAAGSLIVQEAGGQITDLDGAALDFTHGRTLAANRGILASNAALHPAALNGLRDVGA